MQRMNETFLKELLSKDIQIFLTEDKSKIKVKGNISSLTEEDKINISNYKQDIIEILKQQEKLQEEDTIFIEKLPTAENYRISSAQMRLWLVTQIEAASIAHNMPIYFELDIQHIEHFKSAIHTIIERHENLRTVFKLDDSLEVRQHILTPEKLNFTVHITDVTAKINKQALVEEFVQKDINSAFDLENGPLIKVHLFQFEAHTYAFYANIHHIICDGWSLNILKNEIIEIYSANCENRDIQLPTLSIQYKEYAAWQLQYKNTIKYQQDREYWLHEFKEPVQACNLPSNKIRPTIKTYNGFYVKTPLSNKLSAKLKAYSKENEVTVFFGLIASMNILFHKYNGLNDIVLGTPIAGRYHIDLESQIGFYINTLAIRSSITPDASFEDILNQIKQKMLLNYNHQKFPFDDLLEELGGIKDASRSPLFDIMIAMDNISDNSSNGTQEYSITDDDVDMGETYVKYDITINFEEIDSNIFFKIAYNTDVYDQEMIQAFSKHYKILLENLLENPTKSISCVNYLSKEEEKQLITTFNTTKVDYPKDKTIVDLFAEQVSKTPNDTVVVFENVSHTYAELDAISNQFANYLQANYTIENEDLIGISLQRSDWVIIAMLGILKAGGAYVPIDPDYPESRVTYLLNDSNCKALIDEEELQKFNKVRGSYSNENIKINTHIDNLIYIIYTSGTTGKPKGVMITHKNVADYVLGLFKNTEITSSKKFALMTNITSDLGNTILFGSLLSGGTLYLPMKETLLSLNKMHNYLNKNSIDCIKLTPSHWNVLNNKNGKLLLPRKMIIFGGEVLPVSFVEKIKKQNEKLTVINHYGPTETTIGKLLIQINPEAKYNRIPVGKPFSQTSIYIVNKDLRICPIWVTGELLIGGDGVAKGYINNKELTEKCFIQNPFTNQKGKLYRTGDLVRMLSDGSVEFIERKDNQVKIRGHRVELGEIQANLNTNKDITVSIVTVIENKFKENDLVAYYESDVDIQNVLLRSYLRKRLPEFMIPNYFIRLDKIPLMSNGKVNKSILPDFKHKNFSNTLQYSPPTTEVQKKMVKLWEEVLEKKSIGIHDNFFELGGHSLKAVRLVNQIESIIQVKIKIEQLFVEPTIAELSTEIERILWLNTDKSQNSKKKIIEI